MKVLVIVDGRASVTVEVPDYERDGLSLVYDPLKWKDSNLYELAEGDLAVTFTPCIHEPARATQYNGAFVVAGARCSDLEVYQGGSADPDTVTISFGAGKCGESQDAATLWSVSTRLPHPETVLNSAVSRLLDERPNQFEAVHLESRERCCP